MNITTKQKQKNQFRVSLYLSLVKYWLIFSISREQNLTKCEYGA